MLNGLVVHNLSAGQISEGIKTGRFVPSDFIYSKEEEWIQLKDSEFIKKTKNLNGWMALFIISFIFNVVMLLLLIWQNSRINDLLS